MQVPLKDTLMYKLCLYDNLQCMYITLYLNNNDPHQTVKVKSYGSMTKGQSQDLWLQDEITRLLQRQK